MYFSSHIANIFMILCLCGICLIKVYLVPLAIFLLFGVKTLTFRQFIITTLFILIISFSFYFNSWILFSEDRVDRTQVINLFVFFENIFNYFFSVNHGFLVNFHLYAVAIIFMLVAKRIDLLVINLFYIFFFSIFPYWHGDMVGSRFMIPINLVNFYRLY